MRRHLSRAATRGLRLRLGSRLEVDLHVDQDLEQCLVPPMILQPLGENAIVLGLAKSLEEWPGRLSEYPNPTAALLRRIDPSRRVNCATRTRLLDQRKIVVHARAKIQQGASRINERNQ